ncbi:MAG: hypothetical protein V7731_03305 [Amphritea sp.]
MKSLLTIVSMLLLLSASQIAMADSTYTLTQGKPWHGVKVGGSTPHSPNIICRNSNCYQLKTTHSISREIMDKYALQNLSYDQLSGAPGVQLSGERLSLPRDLGFAIHQLAFREFSRSNVRK